MKKLVALVVLLLAGCADLPHSPPVGIWEGGMRMPDDQACAIRGDELVSCREVYRK